MQRQTGRTTRIAQFAVDQLLSVGECIVTDHIVFESVAKPRQLEELKSKIQYLYAATKRPYQESIQSKLVQIENSFGPADKKVYMLHLKVHRE